MFQFCLFTASLLPLLLHFLQPNLAKSSTSSEIRALSGRTLRDRLQKNSKSIPMTGQKALRVLTGIYIESMGNFQATDMSFDVDLYFYMHWKDPSLNHSSEDFVLVNDPKVKDKMWLPDLYFANARNSKFHDVTAPNFNIFIDKTGNIAYSIRITLNVACNLDLANYPMDRQTCGIRIISYAYVESQVNVTWFAHNSTRYNPEIGLPEFKIEKLTPEYCDGTYMYAIMEKSFRRDKFSCLEAVIHLNRQIGYHLVQSFIPTALIVMISWVSFWIDRRSPPHAFPLPPPPPFRAVPARVTLSFTTLLSLSTLGNGLRFGLPQVAYAKAIDFWFGSCMFFVFLSLVEFAAVNSYMREAEKYERLASYSAKKELHLHDENSRWSPDESCGESSLLIFGASESNAGLGSRLMSLASLAVPSLFFGTRKRKGGPKARPANAVGNGPMKLSRAVPNGQMNSCPLHPAADKKTSLGTRLSEHMELHSMDGEEADSLTPNHHHLMTPTPSPGTESPNHHISGNFSPAENRRNIIVPEIQPWPPSPFEKGHPPPPAPRRVRKINVNSSQNERNPLATNHFLREGFRYSRKGLSIDRWSRVLFPMAFTLWNIYYWVYYLWYIQSPHVDRSMDQL